MRIGCVSLRTRSPQMSNGVKKVTSKKDRPDTPNIPAMLITPLSFWITFFIIVILFSGQIFLLLVLRVTKLGKTNRDAAAASLDSSYFFRMFKKHTDLTPAEFIARGRQSVLSQPFE